MTSLTDDQIDRLSGVELDKAIHDAIGKPGRKYWLASNDGGKSYCASTHDSEVWSTEGSIRLWLKDQHECGYLRSYEIVEKTQYHPYHTDQGAALGLLMTLDGPWLEWSPIGDPNVSVVAWRNKKMVTIAEGPMDEAASVMCRAYLKLVNAKGS